MWIAGIVVCLIAAGLLAHFSNRRAAGMPSSSDWDLVGLSASYAAILAPLAAFSVASAVFLANLTRVAGSRQFEDIMALFLIAFIIQMGTALIFATVRSTLSSASQDQQAIVSKRVMYILANLAFYLGLNTSWLGLKPLLSALELHTLAGLFSWILLFSLLSGAARQGAWMRSLLGISSFSSYLIPVLGLLLATAYRLGIVKLNGRLWPPHAPLVLATLIFGLGGILFALETNMIRLQGSGKAQTILARFGPRLLPPYATMAVTALDLLWFSLVMGTPS